MAGETGVVLLQVRNHHTAEAGTPRMDDAELNHYVGYFKNAYGEQAVCVFDRASRRGTLYLGDAGWERGHVVIDGIAPNLVLHEPEVLWLRACWQAASRQ